MLKQFISYIEKNKLTDKDEKILLAVSGGADSVAMLDLFSRAGFNFSIAHCNFKLRGKDADDDEVFVKNLAKKYNTQIFVKVCRAAEYAATNNISIEMAARDLRYQWFEECMTKYGFSKLATAHHLNDNVETVLLNLSRKTGIVGLTGIKALNKNIIRPLLWATKNQILDYCKENKLPFRTDKTNNEVEFQRNKIRHIIIPEFEKINSAFVDNVAKTAEHLSGYKKIVDEYIAEIKKKCTKNYRDSFIIEKKCIQKTASLRTVLYELIKKYGFNETQCINIEESIEKSGLKFFSDKYELTINRENLTIEKKNKKQNIKKSIRPEDIGNTVSIDDFYSLKIEKITSDNYKIDKDSNIGNFDFDKIKFPIVIRNWEFGDWFVPLGMKGKKKLSDFFNDLKIDLNTKREIKILETNGEIMWVAGYRPDERFKITNQTKTILKISLLSK